MAEYSDELDAYGHMEYGVGFGWLDDDERGDWYAYADFVKSDCDQFVRYHIVVNSESGGFIMDGEAGELTLAEARVKLPDLLDYWLEIARDNLSMDEEMTTEEQDENTIAIKHWKQSVAEELS